MEYRVIYSGRKTICIQITEDAEILVRAPYGCKKAAIEKFLNEKENWIRKKMTGRLAEQKRERQKPYTQEEKERLVREAADKIAERTEHYSQIMGVTFTRITIREQKTRWGSCSSKGSLNFNWRLILAPGKVLDYVVIHELAHRKEMNHSPRFYQIIEGMMPDYKVYQTWLREHGRELWER